MKTPLHHAPHKFEVGDHIWLQAKQIKIHQQSAKLGPMQLGPFEVTEVLSDMDYRLALPSALCLHDVFHVDRLSPYKGNEVNGLNPPPPDPVTIDGEEEYEVDHIRDSKMFGCTLNTSCIGRVMEKVKTHGNLHRTWNTLHKPWNSSISRTPVHLIQ